MAANQRRICGDFLGEIMDENGMRVPPFSTINWHHMYEQSRAN
jgi:hypothetical protein